MIDDKIEDEIAPDYGTIAVDGAYIHFPAEGMVWMLFYRDSTFPRHESHGTISFDTKRRTILHEIRISYEQARTFGIELHGGLIQQDRRIRVSQLQKIEAQRREIDVKRSGHNFAAIQLTIISLMADMNEEGQNKVIEMLGSFLEKNMEVFAEIRKKHPKQVTPK